MLCTTFCIRGEGEEGGKGRNGRWNCNCSWDELDVGSSYGYGEEEVAGQAFTKFWRLNAGGVGGVAAVVVLKIWELRRFIGDLSHSFEEYECNWDTFCSLNFYEE